MAILGTRPLDLCVPAPGQARKVAMLGILDHARRSLVVVTARTKRSHDFISLLEQLDGLSGLKCGQPFMPGVLVLDNGQIHTSKLSRAALAARQHWLTAEWRPKNAPELNNIERAWRDLKAYHLAHRPSPTSMLSKMPSIMPSAYATQGAPLSSCHGATLRQ